MSDIAIRCEGLSKQYRIGKRERYRALRDRLTDIMYAPVRALRNALNGPRASSAAGEDTIWALRDVSFEIKHGEVVGIIGRNGAGKSTLLKILSRITEPSKGYAEIQGQVGSLLEVGTGFHPELTGRENIFLNGAILGMRHEVIQRTFDEIVSFAEIERFLDTPVKHYSSGMYIRLAFAVAAHLRPEILIVDEVLAVGDAQFQRKCLGKMSEVSKHGRTVLFVSHNMTAINLLCSQALLLEDGRIRFRGKSADAVAEYLNSGNELGGERVWDTPQLAPGNGRVRFHSVRILSDGEIKAEVDIDKDIQLEIQFWNLIPNSQLFTNIFLLDNLGGVVLESANTPKANCLPEKWFCKPHPIGLFRSTCTIPANFLNDGRYHISVNVGSCTPPTIEAEVRQVLSFNVFDTGAMRTPGFSGRWSGVVRVPLAWRTEVIKADDWPTESDGQV